ncbi:MAG: baseplate J/gp47 family protein [Anaerolineales bacterium]|nr:baseplate J/gp47 family protein [Anaerolineales bacterium]
MKTHILKLENHDDQVSVRDKMGWGKTGRILLVWPERGRILTRRIDLVLLHRHSLSLGAQLGLVSDDPLVRSHARELAIPVFSSVQQANKVSWRQRRKTPPSAKAGDTGKRASHAELKALREVAHPAPARWLRSPAVRVVVFTLGVLAVLAIAATLAPGAEISLSPPEQLQEVALTLTASEGIPSPRLSGQVPAHRLTVELSGELSAPASGSILIPYQAAKGSVLITNLTGQAVKLPSGVVVRTADQSPVRFKTSHPGDLPGGVGETISLPIEALLPGSQGNLPAGALTAIEGELGLNLTVNNPQPTSGGDERSVAAPTSADRLRLFTQLEASLAGEALEAARSKLEPGDVLLSTEALESLSLEKEYQPEERAPADILSLSLRQQYQFLVVRAETLEELGFALLEAGMPDGYQAIPASFKVTHLETPLERQPGNYQWGVKVSRKIKKRITEEQVISAVLGLPVEQALEALGAKVALPSPPEARLSPAWWPRFPILPFRIHVSFE